MEPTVKIDLSGWKNVVKNLQNLRQTVKVGIIDDAENAEKAAKNEFGSFSDNIPSRPFMRKSLTLFGEEAIQKSLDGVDFTKAQGKNKILSQLGEKCAENMVKMIETSENYFVPNAPKTAIEKGFNHPLLDTGEMREAITYRISEANEELEVPF